MGAYRAEMLIFATTRTGPNFIAQESSAKAASTSSQIWNLDLRDPTRLSRPPHWHCPSRLASLIPWATIRQEWTYRLIQSRLYLRKLLDLASGHDDLHRLRTVLAHTHNAAQGRLHKSLPIVVQPLSRRSRSSSPSCSARTSMTSRFSAASSSSSSSRAAIAFRRARLNSVVTRGVLPRLVFIRSII